MAAKKSYGLSLLFWKELKNFLFSPHVLVIFSIMLSGVLAVGISSGARKFIRELDENPLANLVTVDVGNDSVETITRNLREIYPPLEAIEIWELEFSSLDGHVFPKGMALNPQEDTMGFLVSLLMRNGIPETEPVFDLSRHNQLGILLSEDMALRSSQWMNFSGQGKVKALKWYCGKSVNENEPTSVRLPVLGTVKTNYHGYDFILTSYSLSLLERFSDELNLSPVKDSTRWIYPQKNDSLYAVSLFHTLSESSIARIFDTMEVLVQYPRFKNCLHPYGAQAEAVWGVKVGLADPSLSTDSLQKWAALACKGKSPSPWVFEDLGQSYDGTSVALKNKMKESLRGDLVPQILLRLPSEKKIIEEIHDTLKQKKQVNSDQIASILNYRSVSEFARFLSLALFISCVLSIAFFIYHMVSKHLESNVKNLGTLTAFGLGYMQLQVLYVSIMVIIMGGILTFAFFLAYPLGIWLNDNYIDTLLSQTEISGMQQAEITFHLLDLYAVLLVASILGVVGFVTWLTTRNILRHSPGDLVYGRSGAS